MPGTRLLEQARQLAAAGRSDAAWECCRDAAAAARRTGDTILLAEAALVLTGDVLGGPTYRPELHQLCREALGRLGDDQPVLRQRLEAQAQLTRNTWARPWPSGPEAEVDAHTRMLSLRARRQELHHPDRLEELLELSHEALALAGRGSDPHSDEYAAEGLMWRLDALYQLGRRDELDAELISLAGVTQRLDRPEWHWRLATVRASIALLEQRYDDARLRLEEARVSGAGNQEAGFVDLIHRSRLAIETGEQIKEVIDDLRGLLPQMHTQARAWLASMLVAAGGAEEEVSSLWRLVAPTLPATPVDVVEWLIILVNSADLAVHQRDRETGRYLYDTLLPYADVHVVGRAQAPPYGPVGLYLARLARLLGDPAAARQHAGVALRHCERMFAVGFAREVRAELDQLGPATGRLTRREHEVAALIAEGCSNRVISERLFLSERTVESHVANIKDKLLLGSRAAIAVWFVRSSG